MLTSILLIILRLETILLKFWLRLSLLVSDWLLFLAQARMLELLCVNCFIGTVR